MIEEETVLIGFVDGKAGKAEVSSPLESKIGGRPIWHSPGAEPPRCGKCGGDMHFIAQIYAPTEVHRSLYIYCCKSSGCVLLSEGWTILRNQRLVGEGGEEVEGAARPAPSTPAEDPAAAAGPTFSSVFELGGWGEAGGDEGLDDLEALLQQRDDALRAPVPAATPQDTPPVHVSSTVTAAAPSTDEADKEALVERRIRQAEEPDPSSRAHRAAHKGASDEHIMALLSRYIAEEKESLQEEGATASDAASLRLIEESVQRAGAGDAASDNEEDDYDSDSERKLSGGRQSRTEAAFRARLALAPQQVLRYAYGGSPLWCCDAEARPPSGPGNRRGVARVPGVPACEACGGERVFEMQLMPALADYLCVPGQQAGDIDLRRMLQREPPSAEQRGDSTGGQSGGLGLLRLSMGVLCVWSCAEACAGGSREHAQFQPLD